jgi:uncharacterized RDD family membrane protein YckC
MNKNVKITTAQNVQIEYEPASVGDRILATIIDYVIMIAYVGVLALIYFEALGLEDFFDRNDLFSIIITIVIILTFVVTAFYHLIFEIVYNGQSPGKRAMKTKVVNLDGSEVTIGSYIIRWLFRLIDLQLFYGLVAILLVATGKKGQRLGDLVAGTAVVSLKNRVTLQDTIYQKVESTYDVKYISSGSLSSYDIATIKDVLNSNYGVRKDELLNKLAEKVAESIGVSPTESGEHFLRTVVKDYNYLQTQ